MVFGVKRQFQSKTSHQSYWCRWWRRERGKQND